MWYTHNEILFSHQKEVHPASCNNIGWTLRAFMLSEISQTEKDKYYMPAVPNLFGTRDQFRGRQFFHGRRVGGGGGSGGDARHGSGGNASDGERWGAADEALLAHLPTAHLLLCGPAPNRPQTSSGPRPGCWGPLLYSITYIWNLKKPNASNRDRNGSYQGMGLGKRNRDVGQRVQTSRY